MDLIKNFYVYGIFEPYATVPFYVGKGSGLRFTQHTYEAQQERDTKSGKGNKWKSNKIRKILRAGLKPEVQLFKENLTEQEAFSLEKIIIEFYGLRVDVCGPLVNLSYGGEGQSGYKHTDEAKAKISERMAGENNPVYGRSGTFKGMKHTEATKARIRAASLSDSNPMRGNTHTDEVKRICSESSKGRPQSEETRKKRSNSMKKAWSDPERNGKLKALAELNYDKNCATLAKLRAVPGHQSKAGMAGGKAKAAKYKK